MKIKIVLLLLLSSLFISCATKKDFSYMSGECLLQKVNIVSYDKEHWSFFLIAGFGDKYNNVKLNLYWYNSSENVYVFSSVPMEKVKIRIDNSKEIPTVQFKLIQGMDFFIEGDNSSMTENEFIRYYVKYIIITCNEEQFSMNIELNKVEME